MGRRRLIDGKNKTDYWCCILEQKSSIEATNKRDLIEGRTKSQGVWDICEVRLQSFKWRICWILLSVAKENRTLFTYLNKRDHNQKSYVIINIIIPTEASLIVNLLLRRKGQKKIELFKIISYKMYCTLHTLSRRASFPIYFRFTLV